MTVEREVSANALILTLTEFPLAYLLESYYIKVEVLQLAPGDEYLKITSSFISYREVVHAVVT